MSHFVPPVKDMMFVLDQFIGLDQLSRIKGCDEIDKEFLEFQNLKHDTKNT